MLSAFSKALRQLPEPEFRSVLWRAVALTLVAFVVVIVGFHFAVAAIPLTGIGWLDAVIVWTASVAVVPALFLLFPSVATLLISLFLDDIAAAVERRHYPDAPAGRPLGIADSAAVGLRFAGVVILLNLVVLPLYLVPAINLFVYYGLNGYLLSREYFELVALRHLDAAAAAQLRRTNRGRLFLVGVVIAFLLTVPIVNIIAPLVAAAFMMHVFMALRAGGGARPA